MRQTQSYEATTEYNGSTNAGNVAEALADRVSQAPRRKRGTMSANVKEGKPAPEAKPAQEQAAEDLVIHFLRQLGHITTDKQELEYRKCFRSLTTLRA